MEQPVAMRPTHNYSFTSEVRYWFEFQGGEQLTVVFEAERHISVKSESFVLARPGVSQV